MPRGVYERKPKYKVLPDKLRALADEIEEEMKKVENAKEILEALSDLAPKR